MTSSNQQVMGGSNGRGACGGAWVQEEVMGSSNFMPEPDFVPDLTKDPNAAPENDQVCPSVTLSLPGGALCLTLPLPS